MLDNAKILIICSIAALLWVGCKEETPECIPSDKVNVVEVEKTPIPQGAINERRKNVDSCRTCILSPRGFYSCQAAWQSNKKESKDELKQQSKALACKDAGFTPDNCPDSAVKFVHCNGDPVPENTQETELSKSFRKLMIRAGSRIPVDPPKPDDTTTTTRTSSPSSDTASGNDKTTVE